MLQKLLLVLLILDSFILVASILLQSGKGTGMAASFGGVSSSPDAFIGTRQAGNLLTKIGWWSGAIFLAIAFVLQIASARARVPKSVLDQAVTPPPTAPASSAPATPAPALPFQPAPAAAPGVTPGATPPSAVPGAGATPGAAQGAKPGGTSSGGAPTSASPPASPPAKSP
jgi:preprotein translocase subunit SecG